MLISCMILENVLVARMNASGAACRLVADLKGSLTMQLVLIIQTYQPIQASMNPSVHLDVLDAGGGR